MKRRNFFAVIAGAFASIAALWKFEPQRPTYIVYPDMDLGKVDFPASRPTSLGTLLNQSPGSMIPSIYGRGDSWPGAAFWIEGDDGVFRPLTWPKTKRGPSGGWTPETGWFHDPGE